MKAVLLAGGLGTRLSEETEAKPKPMVEIGGKPILWHIMKMYSHFNVMEFIICLGYKGYVIKEYFANYALHMSDVTLDFSDGSMKVHRDGTENWKITLVDTGVETMTGGRIKRIAPYLSEEDFCLTYGDGVGDIDIGKLIKFHKNHGKDATVTVVNQPSRFGAVVLNNDMVAGFSEKKVTQSGHINGGFFVLSPKVIDHIAGDETVWEQEPMNALVQSGQLAAFQHNGFWQPMDTLREKRVLEELWASKTAPWRLW